MRFVVDPHNEVAAPRVLSGSWDATAKLWRLPGKDAEDALPVMGAVNASGVQASDSIDLFE